MHVTVPLLNSTVGCFVTAYGVKNHTYLSIENFLFSVAYWLNDFEEGLKEPKIAQPPGLIVELFPLRLLGDTDKDVGALLLQQMVKRVLPGLFEKIMLDCDQCGLPEALQ